MKRMLSAFVVVAMAASLAGLVLAGPAEAVTGAGFTTVNDAVDVTLGDPGPHCLNGNPAINCNIYTGKKYVWLNGGPSVAYVGAGTYFFAVLAPGGQGGNQNPNDGTSKNLSDTTSAPWPSGSFNADGSSIPSGDLYTNRTFTVDASGTITSYSGTHDFSDNKIRLMPYDDTTNPGGVYIMAICSLDSGYPVTPSDCKYDAFKVQTGEGGSATDLAIVKDAEGSNARTFSWDISKDVDKTEVDQSGTTATFNYTVNVTHDGGTVSDVTVTGTISVFNFNVDDQGNTVPVDITEVTDTLSNGTDCTVTNGGAQTLTDLETDFAYSCDLSGLPEGQLNNKATVSWPDQDLSNGAHLVGSSAPFTFSSIAFTETLVDDCVSVTDTLGGSLGTVCSTDPSPTSFQYQNTVDGTAGTCVTQDNTATFTTDDTGATDSASQSVKLCVGADLTVTKGATPSFDRTYLWTITKDSDKTKVKKLGGTATFTYTIKVTHDAGTDSNWQVNGSITVSNPNDWEAITADVTDAVDNGGSCVVTGGSAVSIPASGSVTLPYTCTYSSVPSPSGGTNTATATWDADAFSTPNGSATGTAGFDFGTTSPNKIDECVTVTDPNAPSNPLGTACVGDPNPKTFTYSKSYSVPQFGCQDFTNTATFTTNDTGTTGSASKTVTVCGPARTGALTMGFWQNKNGQNIIKGGSSTGGVCNSGTWLRQYAPFQDLSASATCTQVATYVFNVIKAANAGGSSMNPMLKAQMLATALDVYFSDPALGGNKIGAPSPIGAQVIDLTQICHMIDGSGGGTCSGTFENVSSAFGGATSMTVSQMLAYAASQSNAGGTSWYGQNKATQGLAKDAFDAINNQVAFGP